MIGLEKMIGRIQADTQKELLQLQQAAEEKATVLRAEAEAQSAALLEAGRAQNAALAENRRVRLVSAANMEARQMILQTKQTCISQAFDQAYQQLEAFPADKYADYLAAWVANAAETGDEALIFSARDREQIGQQVVDKANALREGAAFTLAEETREIRGVVLCRGSVEINGDLDYRFRLLRERLAPEVAEMLFS